MATWRGCRVWARAGVVAKGGGLREEERKQFFSEEKNQKTFTFRNLARYRPGPGSYEGRQEVNVFWFFSSEKNTLPS
jgi:CRISPR/Cas system endoribonuclease Cas6 (RAMP superfamily)